MKILFIHNYYRQPGGEDTALELESALLRQKGHEVNILSFRNHEPGSLFKKIGAGIAALYNPASAAMLEKAIRSFGPDIIHVHNLFFMASPSVLFAAKHSGIPVVLTLHNYRLICANALLLRNNRPCELCVAKTIPLSGIRYRCYQGSALNSAMVTGITSLHKMLHTWQRKVTTYIALTEFSKSKIMASALRLPEKKIIVKPNFVPDPGEGKWPRDDFFLFVGRIAKEKGVGLLLEAFAPFSGCRLIIAGDGPEKETLQEQYRHHDNIYFAGRIGKEEVNGLMKSCRALIFPSLWYEGLPFSILEAFATGTPVIASRIGSMVEMIEDGYNGYHFTPGNVVELRDKIRLLAGNVSQSIYVNARQTYFSKYHPDIHYHAIIDIYKNAIAANDI